MFGNVISCSPVSLASFDHGYIVARRLQVVNGQFESSLTKCHQEDSDDGRYNGYQTQRGNLLFEEIRGE